MTWPSHPALRLAAALLVLASCRMVSSAEEGTLQGGVVVYHRADFDRDLGGFRAVRQARIEPTGEAVSGRALRISMQEAGAGAEMPFRIEGSKGLKMAFLARGRGIDRAWLNVYDRRARDNTTSYAPRFVDEERWSPVLYHLEAFRYNSRSEGTVEAETEYTGVRLFAPRGVGPADLWLDNLVVYRGPDETPPGRVEGLVAEPAADGMRLAWAPAQDNAAVMSYVVSRRRAGDAEFRKVGETPVPRWLDPFAGSGTLEYRVLAVDFERNPGPWSETARALAETGRGAGRGESTVEARTRQSYAEAVRAVHRAGTGRVRKGHVCFFGDSLTHARVYGQMGQAALGIYSVAAHGFPRMRTEAAREKVGEVLAAENPEFLLVLLGTNNLNSRRVPPAEELDSFMADLEAIAEAARSRGTVPLFGTVPPRGFDDPESRPEAAYNAAIHRLGERIGVAVAPIFEDLQAAGDRRRLLAGDGTHWRPDAMEIAGRAWARTMRDVEWILRDP